MEPIIRHGLQFILWILSAVTTSFTLVCTLWNKWSKLNSADMFTKVNPFAGLWYMCDTQLSSQVVFTCYDKFKDIPTFTIMRAVMVIACILSCLALFISMFTMECAAVTRDKFKVKAGGLIIVGIFYMLSGAFTIIIVSWYASLIVKQLSTVNLIFNTAEALNGVKVRMTIGKGCWIGWVTGGVSMFVGLAWICCRVTSDEEIERMRKFNRAQDLRYHADLIKKNNQAEISPSIGAFGQVGIPADHAGLIEAQPSVSAGLRQAVNGRPTSPPYSFKEPGQQRTSVKSKSAYPADDWI